MIEAEIAQQAKTLCDICYVHFEFENSYGLFSEKICYECWFGHVKAVISQMSYRSGAHIQSPFEEGQPIDICIALNSLKKKERDQLQHLLFKKYSSFTLDIQKCPAEDCDYVFTLEPCKWGKIDGRCPKCNENLSKSNKFGLRSLVGLLFFLFGTNRCPKCQIPIIKTEGCSHMKCACGYQFCWHCLKELKKQKDSIFLKHEENQCYFIAVSKIVLAIICGFSLLQYILDSSAMSLLLDLLVIGLKILILDSLIVVSWILILQLVLFFDSIYSRDGKIHHIHSSFFVLFAALLVDLTGIIACFYFQLLFQCAVLLCVEAIIIGMALTISKIMSKMNTLWFDYIM